MEQFFKNIEKSYNILANEYADKFIDEMDDKPFDRKMLELLAERVGNTGILCDLGCGPGNIANYLNKLGKKVCGIDLSEKLVEHAERLNPGIKFYQGNIMDMNMIRDEYFGGVAAFYSLIHIPKELMLKALREIFRTLKKEGTLLIAFHIGDKTEHFDEWWGKKVALDFLFFRTDEMKNYLSQAGFKIIYTTEREPVKEVEVETRRAYIFAEKND